jgi:hypothetical protein
MHGLVRNNDCEYPTLCGYFLGLIHSGLGQPTTPKPFEFAIAGNRPSQPGMPACLGAKCRVIPANAGEDIVAALEIV